MKHRRLLTSAMKHRSLGTSAMKHRRLWLSPPPTKRPRSGAPPSRPAKRPRSGAPPSRPARRQNALAPPRDIRSRNVESALLLFEAPSGFAIFNFCKKILDHMEDIWTYFAQNWNSCSVAYLQEFQTFDDKSSAISQISGVSKELTEMIKKFHRPGQEIAVGKREYKKIIEGKLGISCLYGPAVMEVMWGINKCMLSWVAKEKSQLTLEDPPLLSFGLQCFLCHHGFNFKPETVNDEIIEVAGALYKCESVEKRHKEVLLNVGGLIKDGSGINCENWSLLKIAIALKIICRPEDSISCEIFSEEASKLVNDAQLYHNYLNKEACSGVYGQMLYAHEVKTKKIKQLKLLLGKPKEADEAEQVKVAPVGTISSELPGSVAAAAGAFDKNNLFV